MELANVNAGPDNLVQLFDAVQFLKVISNVFDPLCVLFFLQVSNKLHLI
jgi:hypothetical protein